MAKGKKSEIVESSEKDIESQSEKQEVAEKTSIVEEEKQEVKVNPHTIGKLRQ